MRIVIHRTVIRIIILDGRNGKRIIGVVLRYDNRHRMCVSIVADTVLFIIRLSNIIFIGSLLHKCDRFEFCRWYCFASLCSENILSVFVFFWKRSACRHWRDIKRKLRIGKVIAIRFVCPAVERLRDRDIRLNRCKRITNYQRIRHFIVIFDSSDRKRIIVLCILLYCYNCCMLRSVILNTGRRTPFLSNMVGIGTCLLKRNAAKACCRTICYSYRLLSILCICRHRCILYRCQVKCKAACLCPVFEVLLNFQLIACRCKGVLHGQAFG